MKRVLVLFASVLILHACTNEPPPKADPCKCVDIINNQDTTNVTYDSCVHKMQFDPQFSLAFKKCQYAKITGQDTSKVQIPENKEADLKIPMDGRYELNVAESEIRFIGKNSIIGSKHVGAFLLTEGYIELRDTAVAAGEMTIDITSLNGRKFDDEESRQNFEGHLLSADFFDAENHPTATVKMKSANDRIYKVKVQTDLTIKGITKDTELNIILAASGENQLKVSSSHILNRTDFGINYGSGSVFDNLGDDVIDDEVPVVLDLSFTRVD